MASFSRGWRIRSRVTYCSLAWWIGGTDEQLIPDRSVFARAEAVLEPEVSVSLMPGEIRPQRFPR